MTQTTSAPTPPFENIPFDDVLQCIHCGLCLDVCPTYRELGTEQDSPRGRLYIMRGLWEGEIQPDPGMTAPLDRCLDCRACETACPASVPYGQLLEKTRGAVLRNRKQGISEKILRGFLLNRVLASDRLLLWSSRLSKIYRSLGLARLMARILPGKLAQAHRLMPAFTGKSFKRSYPTLEKTSKATVGLFTGCVMDVAEHQIHQATVQVLEAAGYQVAVPRDQSCCGALQVHQGERSKPRELAQRNEKAFLELDTIIVNSAGCGAQLKEYAPLFSDSSQPEPERWHLFGQKVFDILHFLSVQQDWQQSITWRDDPVTVLYDAPCHLIHAQRTDAGPRSLLSRLPGVTFAPLANAADCCGAAGIYNLQHPETANAIGNRKLDDIEKALEKYPVAKILLTGNPGCLFQIRRGVEERNLPLEVIHPVQFLASRIHLG